MKREQYNAPAIEQEEVVIENGIAASIPVDVMIPEEWEEGNTNWWK